MGTAYGLLPRWLDLWFMSAQVAFFSGRGMQELRKCECVFEHGTRLNAIRAAGKEAVSSRPTPDPQRRDGKALASYVGMIPREYSSGGRQRFGGLSKQGNPLLRFLWGEAGAHAARQDPELQRFYRRKLVQRVWGRRVWRWLANWGSGCGSCCGIRLSTTSSVVVDRSSRKAVTPVRGCQKRGMVRKVTGRLIRLPASL